MVSEMKVLAIFIIIVVLPWVVVYIWQAVLLKKKYNASEKQLQESFRKIDKVLEQLDGILSQQPTLIADNGNIGKAITDKKPVRPRSTRMSRKMRREIYRAFTSARSSGIESNKPAFNQSKIQLSRSFPLWSGGFSPIRRREFKADPTRSQD